jgi:hypothetical protein
VSKILKIRVLCLGNDACVKRRAAHLPNVIDALGIAIKRCTACMTQLNTTAEFGVAKVSGTRFMRRWSGIDSYAT